MARGKLSYMGSVNHEHAFAHHQEPLSALLGSGFESDRNVLAHSECRELEASIQSKLLFAPLL